MKCGKYARKLSTCMICGAVLEPGEVCNCDRRSSALPKDGLRAKCDRFGHRSSYRGRFYINCVGVSGGKVRHQFPDQESRDAYYRSICCGDTPCYAGGRSEEKEAAIHD